MSEDSREARQSGLWSSLRLDPLGRPLPALLSLRLACGGVLTVALGSGWGSVQLNFSFSFQGTGNSQVPQSKYAELLAIIEELGKEIRPTYAGSKSAMERLKRGKSWVPDSLDLPAGC